MDTQLTRVTQGSDNVDAIDLHGAAPALAMNDRFHAALLAAADSPLIASAGTGSIAALGVGQ
jgi:DNA-binding GntR family transcriptional regulator